MLIVATGNQTTVGGFYQMMSGWNIVSPNKCFVTYPTTSGFTLNLYKDIAKLDTGDLILRDKDYAVVPVTGVSKSKTDGVFQISAALSLEKSPYYLQNKSGFWKICTEMFFGQFSDLMEGVTIDLSANALGQLSQEPALNLMYDGSAKQIRFESTSVVKTVSMYSLAGTLMGNWKIDQLNGGVSIVGVTSGVYVLKFALNKGSVVKKIMLTN